jgi:hypothetical protein
MTKTYASSHYRFEHWNIGILNLPFDSAQGREPVERLVEPFRI